VLIKKAFSMFHDPSNFVFIKHFQQNWKEIRREVDHLDHRILDVHRIGTHEEYFTQTAHHNGWSPCWKVGSIEKNFDWLTYGLAYEGQFPDEASEKFPVMKALIAAFPGIKAAALSKMNPASLIAPHVHPELGGNLLTFHLGIDVEPRKSYLFVNGVPEQEQENKAIVFDGSVEHFAINVANTSRTVLYIEFDRSKL
jgi:aspartyl/asparaginyl beta-hydroxylase (cupin superfamily)